MEPGKNFSENLKNKFYLAIPSHIFSEQLDNISKKGKKIIKNKLLLAETNPFRNKTIKGFPVRLFRIRFKDRRKEKRVVYYVEGQYIKVVCIIDRDKDYKDLEKYLKKLGVL